MRITHKKNIILSIAVACIGITVLFGAFVRAQNDILVVGKLWEEGLAFWEASITVEPGQTFKITHLVSHTNPETLPVTGIALADVVPAFSSYVPGSAYRILEQGGSWEPMADGGTFPFAAPGVSPHSGTLAPLAFINYKYVVQVDNFLPAGTTQLAWNGPVFRFTDGSGPQVARNSVSTSISVTNVPSISSFALDRTSYRLGDTITAIAQGSTGKTVRVSIGSIFFNLSESGGVYIGMYSVQAGDDLTNSMPRVYFDNGNGTGSYLDATSSITIDTVPPPAASNLAATVDQNTRIATITWDAASPEGEVVRYLVYSNSGSGNISYVTPVAMITANGSASYQYQTAPLVSDALYIFAVRTHDQAGNVEQNTTVVYAATDFTPPDPPYALVQPTTQNDTVFTFGVGTSLQFAWEPSASDDVARYRVEIDDNNDFSSVIASLETTDASTSLTATSTQVALLDGIYYWRAFAIDDAENVSEAQTAPDNIFEIDALDPSVAVVAPLTGSHVAGDFTISGTAFDPGAHMQVASSTTGIAKVEIFLQNFTASPATYWNGAAWVSQVSWLTATSTNAFFTWEYTTSAPITNGAQYFSGARVTDEAGNFGDSILIGLLGNTSSPNVNITSPVDGAYQGTGVTIVGTALDPGGTALTDVSVSIQRDVDSLFWNGTSWVAEQSWNTATSTNAFLDWSYVFEPDLSAPDDTVYTILAQAADGVFGTPNVGISSAITTIKDTIAPTVAIASPLAAGSPYNAASWALANPISGTAHDTGSGVSGVELSIQDSNGNYWNGVDWSAPAATWFSASTADGFANWTYGFTPNKDNVFTVYARSKDSTLAAPNQSITASETIGYDTIAPAISSATVTNSTVGNITTLIKKGDVFIISATITDALQAGMTELNITANISALTGSSTQTTVTPASYSSATGEVVWNFGVAAPTADGNLSITINASDPAGNSVAFTDTAIIVADSTAPTTTATTLTVPSVAGIAWQGDATETITWNAASITDNFNLAANPITLEYATSTQWILIASNEANDGTYDWTLPVVDSDTITVRITVTDEVGNASNDVSDATFTIDSTVPTVTASALTAPNGGEAWKQGTTQTITWDAVSITDNFNLAANPITLEYATSTQWILIASNEANDGAYDWLVPTIDETAVRVRITATDEANNTANDESGADFAIGLPPALLSVRAISDTEIEMTWNKSIASVVGAGAFSGTGINNITAIVYGVADPRLVTIAVDSLGDTGFVSNDFAIAAGAVVDAYNFMNEPLSGIIIADAQLPQTDIAASYPTQDQLIVDYMPHMRIAISEEPDLAALRFQLDGADWLVAYDVATGTIAFDVSPVLAPGQHTITLDLVDRAGNTEPTRSWNFWVDQFLVSVTQSPVAFRFNGNLSDETDSNEQQTVSISTLGVGYTIYARFNPSLENSAGNTIQDIAIKEDFRTWAEGIDLNGITLVPIVSVATASAPSAAPQVLTHTFNMQAVIPNMAQVAGNYAGILEFVVIPSY